MSELENPRRTPTDTEADTTSRGASLDQVLQVPATLERTVPDAYLDTNGHMNVQRYIDAKPALFRKHAQDLQSTGGDIIAAVTKHDGKKLTQVANALDEVCENCHVVFWYPQQAAPPK